LSRKHRFLGMWVFDGHGCCRCDSCTYVSSFKMHWAVLAVVTRVASFFFVQHTKKINRNEFKCTKRTQSIPNDHKIYQFYYVPIIINTKFFAPRPPKIPVSKLGIIGMKIHRTIWQPWWSHVQHQPSLVPPTDKLTKQ
jgi:hypothetical protein